MTILYLVAMQAEANPVIETLHLTEQTLPALAPFKHFTRAGGGLHLLTSGKDFRFDTAGNDHIGLAPAAAMAFAGINAFSPDLVVNFGMAGAFSSMGSSIADVYLCRQFRYHDRQVFINSAWERYGEGNYNFDANKYITGLPEAICSSGNSLTIEPHQKQEMEALAQKTGLAIVKDMEAAAIAQICHMKSVPLLAFKAVTDLIDGPKPSHEEFEENFMTTLKTLHKAVSETSIQL